MGRRANSTIIGGVVAIIIAAVFLAVGTYVMAQIQEALPSVSDSTANQTIQSVWSMAWTGFQLMPIALIVLSAVVILSVLIKGFNMGGEAR